MPPAPSTRRIRERVPNAAPGCSGRFGATSGIAREGLVPALVSSALLGTGVMVAAMAHFDASAIGALQDTQRPPYAGDSTPHFGQAIDLNWDSDYALKLAARPANPCVLRSFADACGRRISIVCREVLGFGDYRQRADPGLQ